MAQSILIFDFGSNEDAAQQARHKIEGWKQAFRLGNKVQWKFERLEPDEQDEESDAAETPAGEKKRGAKDAEAQNAAETPAHIRILMRLVFSDHEKLSHQRWLDRIPAEEPFKSVESETVRESDAEFEKTADLFDSLD
jgi:hypothetical protein